ncbi:MAG: UDP-4-amino-4,6-dideoxy-N-acetyl-beta-L-altrosamine transaminase [Bacteroidales bacterium]|nr:UDP-4-amino-4,6-dideoxy-N-acetyl-beta-L-altrosamine transaminase [Bacteroidales bacterium]
MATIPYGRQKITKQDINAVVKVLKSDFLTQGPVIQQFEETFAKYVGSKYAIAVANGTAALHLSAIALSVDSNSKVITSPITFAASANCIRYCGGEVVFADINEKTYLLDINKVRDLLEASPRGTYSGIIPIDFAGYPVNLIEFRDLADEFGLWILEDACHAPGGYFTDKEGNKHFCGSGEYAELAIFSFHPVKHIAAGEGGMITTNDINLYNKLIMLRSHGITKDKSLLNEDHGEWYYEMLDLGYNYRLTDIQAALAMSQLNNADKRLNRRIQIASIYDKSFETLGITTPFRSDNFFHAFHLYVIKLEKRKQLFEYLRQMNIFPQVHYIPVHLQPYYRNLGWKQGDLPLAENYYKECLSLPMYPSLLNKEQNYVTENILKFLNE